MYNNNNKGEPRDTRAPTAGLFFHWKTLSHQNKQSEDDLPERERGGERGGKVGRCNVQEERQKAQRQISVNVCVCVCVS